MTIKTRQPKAPAGKKNPAATTIGGGPPMIDVDLIDEDPLQPRSQDNPGFTPQSIGELAASYGPNGPKSPISLRDNIDKPGRYIINHGHRRYRAAKAKGLGAIPAFIDNEYNQIDQIIENLQRDELTPREIADWIGRELARDRKRTDIAKSIGKSAAYVTQHATLLDLPVPISEAFNSGRMNDVTVVNELVTAYKKSPQEVATWLGDTQREVTRGEVKLLREFLEQKRSAAPAPALHAGVEDDTPIQDEAGDVSQQESGASQERTAEPDRLGKAIVLVEHDGRPARLNLKRRPTAVGFGWLKYEDDGQEVERSLAEVKLVAVIEGST